MSGIAPLPQLLHPSKQSTDFVMNMNENILIIINFECFLCRVIIVFLFYAMRCDACGGF